MFEQIINVLKKSENIGISFHVSPDGDSVGSSLALLKGLRSIGKTASILTKELCPKFLNFLPDINELDAENKVSANTFDLIIILDCGDLHRINYDLDVDNKKYVLINIDHHMSNQMFGDINFVETKYSSMGEIVFLLLEEMNISIDTDMANCLYTSIISDCGLFKYSNTTSLTHNIAGKLIDKGIDFTSIHRKLYETKNYELVKFSGKVIDSMYLACNNKLCILEATEEMLYHSNIDPSDISDMVNIGIEIEGVEVSMFIKEYNDKLKVSLRSKTTFDVRLLAEKFGGGGHIKAAGFTFSGTISELKQQVIYYVNEAINDEWNN